MMIEKLDKKEFNFDLFIYNDRSKRLRRERVLELKKYIIPRLKIIFEVILESVGFMFLFYIIIF